MNVLPKKGEEVIVINLENTRKKYGLGYIMKVEFKKDPLKKYVVQGHAYDGESVFLRVGDRSFTYNIHDLKSAKDSPYKNMPINNNPKLFDVKNLE